MKRPFYLLWALYLRPVGTVEDRHQAAMREEITRLRALPALPPLSAYKPAETYVDWQVKEQGRREQRLARRIRFFVPVGCFSFVLVLVSMATPFNTRIMWLTGIVMFGLVVLVVLVACISHFAPASRGDAETSAGHPPSDQYTQGGQAGIGHSRRGAAPTAVVLPDHLAKK